MFRTVLNQMLVLGIVVLALMAWFLRRDFTQPNYVFTPEMVFSIPYDSFSPNPNFKDGKTMQLPVAGTVSRDAPFFDYEATEADALRAGKELTQPWRELGIDTDQLMAAKSRGQKVYSTFCLPCHGAVGNGDGPVAKSGFPPPPSLSLEHSLQMSDGQMFHVLTFGQKNMPGYAAQVSVEDRWKAILHVRSIQETAILAAETEALAQSSIEAGRVTFERLNCSKCHTVSPGEKPVGPFLGIIAGTYTREQLHESILHPSKTIAAGFLAQVFLMMDGTTHSGFVTGETDEAVTIRNSDGNEFVLVLDDIDERKTLEKSPMPEGLIEELPDEELQSLLDYLKSLAIEPPPADAAESNQDGEPEKTDSQPAGNQPANAENNPDDPSNPQPSRDKK